MHALLAKLRALFRRKNLEAEMAEEMRQHLEWRTQEKIAEGMTTEEARYTAQLDLIGRETKDFVLHQPGFISANLQRLEGPSSASTAPLG